MRVTPAVVAITLTLVGGCANPPILYGPDRYAALLDSTPVQIYLKSSDIEQPYKILGLVSATDLGKYQVLTIQDSFPTLEAKARSIGADAVIIESYQPVKSGIISTGYAVSGRAIRIQPSGPSVTGNRPVT